MLCIYPQNASGQWPVRCQFDNGAVWFIVSNYDGESADLYVYDEDVLKATRDNPALVDTHESHYDILAKNKFGSGRILRALRALRSSFPTVKFWKYKRESGATTRAERTRTYGWQSN